MTTNASLQLESTIDKMLQRHGFMKSPDNGGVFSYLATLPEDTMLTEKAMAEAFNVCARTIRRMVTRYEIPPPIAVGGRSCWFAGKVLAWLHEAAERGAREAEKVARRNW